MLNQGKATNIITKFSGPTLSSVCWMSNYTLKITHGSGPGISRQIGENYLHFFLFYSASVFPLKSVALIPPIGKYLVRKCESFSGGSAGVCCSVEAWQWVASQDQEDYFNIEYCVTENRIPHRLFTWDHTSIGWIQIDETESMTVNHL